MKKSILTDDMEHCYICGAPMECIHHVCGGNGRRKISDDTGVIVPLCNACHNFSSHSVHFDHSLDIMVKRDAQRAFEQTHTRADWISKFGRNYL